MTPSTPLIDQPVRTRFERFRWAPVDVYRDIHKGLRAELFSLVVRAGSLDLTDPADRHDLGRHLKSTIDVLESHAHHEDEAIHPMLATHYSELVGRLEEEHARFDGHLAAIGEIADELFVDRVDRRTRQALYLELSAFTSGYLVHLDLEERVVMPTLFDQLGPSGVAAVLGRIIESIPPDQMTTSLSLMLPALDLDDRVDLLGGMQAEAPAEVFDGVLSLARSVLHRSDFDRLAQRLELVAEVR